MEGQIESADPLFNTIHYNIKEVLSLFFPDQQNNMVVSY